MMHLFHLIVVFSLNEEEKRAFLEAGVEFTRTTKTSRGEDVMFEIAGDDPRYERVAALLKSLGAERFHDSSMTTPTLRDWVAKKLAAGGERLKQEAAVLGQWERGREVIRQSTELLQSGKKEEARQLLDPAIAEAIQGRHSRWASVLCRCAAAISLSMGDRQRQIHYEEQALPFATDYGFAAYNFARLLLSDGQLARAEHYAAEAYRESITQTADADRDLITAILRQWPNIAQGV
jgi:hypothetical protein